MWNGLTFIQIFNFFQCPLQFSKCKFHASIKIFLSIWNWFWWHYKCDFIFPPYLGICDNVQTYTMCHLATGVCSARCISKCCETPRILNRLSWYKPAHTWAMWVAIAHSCKPAQCATVLNSVGSYNIVYFNMSQHRKDTSKLLYQSFKTMYLYRFSPWIVITELEVSLCEL